MTDKGSRAADDAVPSVEVQDFGEEEEQRPPLPPRPSAHRAPPSILHSPEGNAKLQKPSRPQLQSTATTALSLTDIHTQSFQDSSRETFAAQAQPASSGGFLKGFGSIRRLKGYNASEADSASVRSYAPTLEAGGDVESLLGEVLSGTPETPSWKQLGLHAEGTDIFGTDDYEDDENTTHFDDEFDEVGDLAADGANEGRTLHLTATWILKDGSRVPLGSMEGKKKALPDIVIGGKANL